MVFGVRSGATPSFGALLRRHRTAAGLTHEALAERARLSARAISDLERGVARSPRPATLALLADALGLTGDERRALEGAARPGEEPAPVEHPRHNLPAFASSFVGRAGEIAELRLLVDASRLITLTGAGGCGKTRLAVELAGRLAAGFPDGAWLVDLAPVADETLVPRTVLSTLQLGDVPGRPPIETLAERLRDQRLLLLLDNCEHLVEACARLADALVRACPRLHLLATSREVLGVPGEATWRVPSLSLPAQSGSVDGEAVQLFVDRARLARSSFGLTESDAPVVGQICRRLDGIPLAIELAAACVRVLTVEQIAARLDEAFGPRSGRFHLLTGGSRTALPRQQTLRAAIDWSYDLLTAAERCLLSRLSVFSGGWTLDAGEGICAGDGIADPDILGLLTRLVDKSLVVVDQWASGGKRYRLLETIRQYAAEKLAGAGETAAVRERHGAWFLAFAEWASAELDGPSQGFWFDRLDADHDNLRAALDWSEASADAEAHLRLVAALSQFWQLHGHLVEGRARVETALARRAMVEPRARAKALCAFAHVLIETDVTLSAAVGEETLTLARELGDGRELALALMRRSAAYFYAPDRGPSVVLAAEGLELARRFGTARDVADATANSGRALANSGDLAGGKAQMERGLALLRDVGNEWLASFTQAVLGIMAIRDGDYPRARADHEESLAIKRRLRLKRGIASAIWALGLIDELEGDHAAAAEQYRESLRLYHTAGEVLEVGRPMRALACIAATRSPERAARLFGAGYARFGRMRPPGTSDDPWPDDARDPGPTIETVRRALGDEAFDAAWTAGSAMTEQEAVDYALGMVQSGHHPA